MGKTLIGIAQEKVEALNLKELKNKINEIYA